MSPQDMKMPGSIKGNPASELLIGAADFVASVSTLHPFPAATTIPVFIPKYYKQKSGSNF